MSAGCPKICKQDFYWTASPTVMEERASDPKTIWIDGVLIDLKALGVKNEENLLRWTDRAVGQDPSRPVTYLFI
jgi:hypothetical protein